MQPKEKFLTALEESLQRSPCQSPRRSCILSGKGCAGTGHCCSCSAEAFRSRALCSQYSVAEKGTGHFWICPFWLAKVASVHQPPRPFTGVQVLGRTKLGSWAAFCFLFLILDLYLGVFQGRFFVFVKVSEVCFR